MSVISEEKQGLETSDKPSRMTRRRLETRAKLLNATLALVIEKGFDKTTMDDITEKADLGRRTLYYHFDSKEACVIAAAEMSYGEIAAQADRFAHQHLDPALAFAVAGQLVMRSLIEAPITRKLVEYPRLLAAAIRKAIENYVDQDLALGMEQGRFSLAMRGPLMDSTLMWALVGILIETIENDLGVDDSLAYFTQILLIFLGLSREEAEALSQQAVELIK